VLCGDFNTGFPGENRGIAKILSERFEWLTEDIGGTCRWRRLEPTGAKNRTAIVLGKLFGICLPIDHAFATPGLLATHSAEARALPEFDASDHLPIFVRFEPRT
jgi:endonuclease/exonuclease/phosphatase (EEP) superfamily protein YafD